MSSRRSQTAHPKSLPVTVQRDQLSFGKIFQVSFMRTLRVSETGLNALPPGFGRFPVRNVAHLGNAAPLAMRQRGGVALPMYQCEALWMHFSCSVPVAVQIGAGLRCAVTGGAWAERLRRRPQNYVNAQEQPWLDGFKTAAGEVRQFVAAPLGKGATVEEQLSDAPPVGGIQVQVWELTPEAFARWHKQSSREETYGPMICYSSTDRTIRESSPMGLGAGGRIRQEIYRDTFQSSDWRDEPSARAWVHLVAANEWTALTGEPRPATPVNTDAYVRAGLPWYDYFNADLEDVAPSEALAGVQTVEQVLNGGTFAPGAWTVSPSDARVIGYGDQRSDVVLAGDWG